MDLFDPKKKNLVIIIAVVAFMYSTYLVSSFFLATAEGTSCEANGIESCPHEKELKDLIEIIPLIAGIAVIVGALIYYFMGAKVETKQVSLERNTGIILKFLTPEEKSLVNLLIESRGKILQAEATRLPNMNKVKTHRVVQKLIDKGVIEKDSLGKTNIIRFAKEIMEGLGL